MKKVKFFALVLALAMFLLTGCSLNQNLKLTKTNLSAAQFYANTYYNAGSNSIGMDNVNIQSETERYMLMQVVTATMGNEYDLLAIVCAMDFHSEISSGSENTERSKLYEFEDEGFNNLIVNIVKKSAQIFTATLYITREPVTNLEGVQSVMEVEIKLLDVSKNINYTLTYKKDGKSNEASFTYDKDKSYMKIAVAVAVDTTVNHIVREIYDYVGDPCSIRTTSTIKIGGVQTLNSIYEIMRTPYLIKQKAGELNGSALINLDSVSQDEIASANTSDKWCYVLTSSASQGENSLVWKTDFVPYGSME